MTIRNRAFYFYAPLLILMIGVLSCSHALKKEIVKNKDGSKGIIFEYADNNDTSNYIIKVYYPDGHVQKEMKVSNNMFVGRKITYYDKGEIYQIDSFYKPFSVNVDSWEGISTCYYEDGKIASKYVVRNGKFNGLSLHYNGQGILVKSYYLINDSIKDGPYYDYHENGRIATQIMYKMDTIVGYMYFFTPNGDTTLYFNHYKGRLDFPYKKWLDNGIILEGHSMNKKETVVMWVWHDKNGRELKRKVVRPVNGSFVVPKL